MGSLMAFFNLEIRRILGVQFKGCLVLLLTILILQIQFDYGGSQQAYLNNKQYDCYVNYTNTEGYVCNGSPSCTSYFTFRTTVSYSSVPSIAYLLSAEPSAIAAANNVTDIATFPENHLLFVPVNCSCAAVASGKRYYQHNATYELKSKLETYQIVANDTYEGLTTCQAMMAQNKFDSYDLIVGSDLVAPLMCACPSTNQSKKGFKYIVSYLADWDDDISTVADLFGVDEERIYEGNELNSSSTIYPFNPILVPLKSTPTKVNLNSGQSTSSPPPQVSPLPSSSGGGSSSSTKKWVFVGVGIGAALVALPILFLFIFLLWRRRKSSLEPSPPAGVNGAGRFGDEESAEHKALQVESKYKTTNSWSLSSNGVRSAIESLTIYKFEDLRKATGHFNESNKMKGSVFRATFNGDKAAVKVLNGDVSAEINILKQINHSNIIRLSGFCVHDGSTYLVHEFAEKGSLRDLLIEARKEPYSNSTPFLGWMQRVQIAYDIAESLNYLHNYSNPSYIHKNLSSSNVLLDGNFRAKITNFSLARILVGGNGSEDQREGLHMTRNVVGTQGYLAPEYIENGVVTPKMDVFAFGVVVLEILSGRVAGGKASEKKGKNGGMGEDDEVLDAGSVRGVLRGENVREKLRRFMDSGLKNQYPLDLSYKMAQLAKTCVAQDLNPRPSVSEVLMVLSKIHSSSLDWDPLDELDRSSSLTQGR